MHSTARLLPATLLLSLAASPLARAGSPILSWPGPAPCNGTLQACIDAAGTAGIVELRTDATVNESLAIGQSLTLRAVAGFRPALASGRGITASGGGTELVVRIEGLSLSNGNIVMQYSGTGNATLEARRNRLRGSGTAGAGIRVENTGSGSLVARVEENRLDGVVPSLFVAAIEVGASAGSIDAQVLHNRIDGGTDSEGWGILVDATGGASVTAAVAFNEVRGRFVRNAIGVSEGLFSSTDSTLLADVFNNVVACGGRQGGGIGFTLGDGSIDTDLVNNTIVQCGRATGFSRWSSSDGGGSIVGNVVNNLIAFNQVGLFFNPEFDGPVANQYNLVFGNGSNQYTAGPGTLTVDPLLLGEQHPWLRAGSPAIDAGNPFAPFEQDNAGLLQLDAAGLRRVKGTNVDIGAYEFGDTGLLHGATVDNTGAHITSINGAPFDSDNDARLQVTPSYNGGSGPPGPAMDDPLGVYDAGGHWSIFAENFAAMLVGTRFNVFAPAQGPGVFAHVATPGNISAWSTQLDDPQTTNFPNRIVLATQNWAASGSGVYNAHPIAVFHFGLGADSYWFVTNADQLAGVDMPDNAGFNIYAQDPSPNAFRATATADTASGQALLLEHPLLDDTPCAQPQATRISSGGPVAEHFDVRYFSALGRWGILHQGVPSMPLGSEYFVLVDPLQVHLCTGDLFRDGFE